MLIFVHELGHAISFIKLAEKGINPLTKSRYWHENENLEGPNMIKHTFKKDRFVRTRGGSSEFLDIYCSSCQTHLALYQKDGHGSLIRMYLDRIFEPSPLSELQNSAIKNSTPALKCPTCDTLIAVPMVYKPEKRLALRLIRGTFFKKRSKGIYPPK